MVLKTILNDLKVEDYQKLRATTGWDMYHDAVVERSLGSGLFSVYNCSPGISAKGCRYCYFV